MQERLAEWLALIDGPGWRGERDRVVREIQHVGVEAVFPLLAAKLANPDADVRCRAVTALLFVDASRAMPLVLPMLGDPDSTVRWHTTGCLHDFVDGRAIAPLIGVLRGDPDAGVRTTAAYALGGIASPAAIPALLAALDSDHEEDPLGHTASSCAATALDEILGTNETRLRVTESLRRLGTWPPDLDRLRRLATELYREWSGK